MKPTVLYSPEPAKGWLPWGALAPFVCIFIVALPAIAAWKIEKSLRAGGRDRRSARLRRALLPAVHRLQRHPGPSARLGALRRAALAADDRPGRRATLADLLLRPGRRDRDLQPRRGGDLGGRRLRGGGVLPGVRVAGRHAPDRHPVPRLRRAVERRGDPLPRLAALRRRPQAQRHPGSRPHLARLHAPALQPASALEPHAGDVPLLALRLRLGALERQHLGRHGLARGVELVDRRRLRAADHRYRNPPAGAAGPAHPGRSGSLERRRRGSGGELPLHALLRRRECAAVLEAAPEQLRGLRCEHRPCPPPTRQARSEGELRAGIDVSPT